MKNGYLYVIRYERNPKHILFILLKKSHEKRYYTSCWNDRLYT